MTSAQCPASPLGAVFHKALLQMRLHLLAAAVALRVALVVFTFTLLVQGLDVPSLPGVLFSSVHGFPNNSRNIPLEAYPDVAHNGSGVGSYPLLLSSAALQKSVMNFGEGCSKHARTRTHSTCNPLVRAACSKAVKQCTPSPACSTSTSDPLPWLGVHIFLSFFHLRPCMRA